MGIINKLTIKYITKNLKRSLMAFIGIIIASALISGVCFIFTSMRETIKQTIINEDGYYHIMFNNIDLQERKNIYDSLMPDSSYEKEVVKDADNSGVSVEDIKVGFLKFDKNGFEQNKIKLKEGKFPTNLNEVVIPYDLSKKMNIKIGDTVNYFGENKVVGFIEDYRYYFRGGNAAFFIGLMDNSEKGKFDYYVAFDNVSMNKIDEVKDYANTKGLEFIQNTRLIKISCFDFKGDDTAALIKFLGILLIITGIVSISLLYNAFSISVNARKKEMSILGCTGATRKQIRKIVYREINLLGFVGTTIGILFGILGIKIVFVIVNYLISTIEVSNPGGELHLHIDLFTILASYVISFITLWIAGIAPAKKAKNVSLIEGVRGQNSIDMSKRTLDKFRKSSKFYGFLVGYEGVIAKKNMLRNKKQYRVTVISLILSAIIFLVGCSFVDITLNSYDEKYGGKVDSSKYMSLWANNKSDINKFKEFIKDNSENIESYDLGIKYDFKLVGTDKTSVELYLLNDSGGKEFTDYDLDNGILLIQDNSKFDNDKLVLQSYDDENIKFELTYGKKIINKGQFGKMDIERKIFVITEKAFKQDLSKMKYSSINMNINGKENDLDSLSSNLHKFAEDNRYTEINLTQMYKIFNVLRMIIYIFVFGFIALVSLISVLNMVNTVSSNIQVRIKEISILRSVGMSKAAMMKMLIIENAINVIKTLVIALPISLGIHILMLRTMNSYGVKFFINPVPILIVVVALIIFTAIPTIYSTVTLRKADIIAGIK